MIEIKVKNNYGYGFETVNVGSITYDTSCFEIIKTPRANPVWTNGQPPSWQDQVYDLEIKMSYEFREMFDWYKNVKYQIPNVGQMITLTEMIQEYHNAKNLMDINDPRVKNALVNLLLVAKLSKEDTQKG